MTPALLPETSIRQTRIHQVSICDCAGDDHAFFLEIEEQTTWENLPADRRDTSREELRRTLLDTLETMLAAPGNALFIAEDEHSGEKTGLLWLGTRFNAITGEHEAWIYNITVVPAYRGQGVAKKLMLHAEVYARENGFSVIGLAVATHNEAAQKLYEKLDYQPSNVLMRKPLDGDE